MLRIGLNSSACDRLLQMFHESPQSLMRTELLLYENLQKHFSQTYILCFKFFIRLSGSFHSRDAPHYTSFNRKIVLKVGEFCNVHTSELQLLLAYDGLPNFGIQGAFDESTFFALFCGTECISNSHFPIYLRFASTLTIEPFCLPYLLVSFLYVVIGNEKCF